MRFYAEKRHKVNHYDRVCASVNLDAIVANMRTMKDKMNTNTKIMAVVKSDGYGHGALPIAHRLEKEDYVYGFATATAEEALILRRAGIVKPILILGYTFPYSYEALILEDISLTVFKEDTLFKLAQTAQKVGKNVRVHIKVDTGMHRIGIQTDASGKLFVKKVLEQPFVTAEGIFTHLANADVFDKTDALRQIHDFNSFVSKVQQENDYSFQVKHCSNSAAIMEIPSGNLDVVRAGISMYGLWPSEEMNKESIQLQPALSLHSKIVYMKELPKGSKISYGGTFETQRTTKVATIPVGYGDGYPRGLSNKGYVLIHGQCAPILGRVCMDQFMVDVTDIPNTKEGDLVTLIGTDGKQELSIEKLCSLYDGFNYEMICGIGKRVPKEYYENGKKIYSKDYHDDLW